MYKCSHHVWIFFGKVYRDWSAEVDVLQYSKILLTLMTLFASRSQVDIATQHFLSRYSPTPISDRKEKNEIFIIV